MARHLRITVEEVNSTQLYGVAAMPVQDGGNSITVDGEVTLGTASFVIGKVGHLVTSIADGRMTVQTAGVAAQLSTVSTPCEYIDIQSLTTNTGVMAIGGSTVLATATQRRGVALIAGDVPYRLLINNLNLAYLDATFANSTAHYSYGA